MNSPQRLFFLTALVCMLLGWMLQVPLDNLASALLQAAGPEPTLQADSLTLARHYVDTGQPVQAVDQLAQVISTLPPADAADAQNELQKLLSLQESPLGQAGFALRNIHATWPTRLYLAAVVLALLWVGLVAYRLLGKRPEVVVLPFADQTGLKLGEEVPQAVQDRLREITGQAGELSATHQFISEKLKMPTQGPVSEGLSLDVVALAEVALFFSFGRGNHSLYPFLYSIKLWFQQPRYWVRGRIQQSDNGLIVHMQLHDRKHKQPEQVWCHHLTSPSNRNSDLVDAILYPLIYHFSTGLGAARWEALHGLHAGLEKFRLFQSDPSTLDLLQQAEQELERALNYDRAYDLAHYNLGLVMLATGEYGKAREHIQEAIRLARSPQVRTWATYNYGVALFHVAQDWAYKRAVNTFRELIKKPEGMTPELATLARGALAMTYARMAGPKPPDREFAQQALAEAEQILQSAPPSLAMANALDAKGYAFLALGDANQAVQAFQAALALVAQRTTSLTGLAEAHLRLDQREPALCSLQQAAALAPLGGYIHYKMGEILRQMGEREDAMQAYQKALGVPPAHLALGKVYLEDGLLVEAVQAFREATLLNRHLGDAWVNLAWALLEMEDASRLGEAVTAARRAVQLEQKNWHRHAVLSRALLQAGRTPQALLEANRALELGPQQPQAHFCLANVQQRMGENAPARDSYRKVLELDKRNHWRGSALQMLAEVERAL